MDNVILQYNKEIWRVNDYMLVIICYFAAIVTRHAFIVDIQSCT